MEPTFWPDMSERTDLSINLEGQTDNDLMALDVATEMLRECISLTRNAMMLRKGGMIEKAFSIECKRDMIWSKLPPIFRW